MTAKQPFAPTYGSNQVLTSSSSSASVAITPGNKQLRVVNTGSNKAYFKTYNSQGGAVSKTASTADCCVAAGMATTVTVNADHDKLAHISANGTTLEVMEGEGF